ncbi:MAG: hypothetical protein WBP89_02460 [Sedimenticolaceae bacterium]
MSLAVPVACGRLKNNPPYTGVGTCVRRTLSCLWWADSWPTLKATFKSALFDRGSAELNLAAKEYRGELAGKLGEKPKLAVR